MKTEDIYYYFRKAQAEKNNRGFRMPKDFNKHLETKFSKKNRESLQIATNYFNTKWNNIDPFKFMECGFELFKTFSYVNFFDQRVINLYKQKDKNIKRESKLSKTKIKNSMLFVKNYIKENNIKNINIYCIMKNGHINIAIEHYLNNYIDKFFIVWLIKKKLLKLDDNNMALIPYINDHYRKILPKLDEINDFLLKLEKYLE
jgi:hypothetical protein